MRLVQLVETVRMKGFRDMLGDYLYIGRKAIPVEKDLGMLKPLTVSNAYRDLLLTPITKTDLDESKYHYQFKNRELKAIYYLNRGYRGYVVIRGSDILGDIWYWSPSNLKKGVTPKDLHWLGIECNVGQVYSFDLFSNPTIRGNNMAAFFFNSFFHALKKDEVNKVYGYFWADNTPALRVHRLVGFGERQPVFVDRFLFFKRIRLDHQK